MPRHPAASPSPDDSPRKKLESGKDFQRAGVAPQGHSWWEEGVGVALATGGGWGGSFSSQPAALACRSVSLMSVTASSEGSVGGKQAKNKDEAERMGSTDLPTFPVSP